MTTLLPLPDTGQPKRVILDIAFEERGLAGYEFDRDAEEVTMALRRLNVMMGQWPWSLVPFDRPTRGQGRPEDPSGLPDNAIQAVAMHLASLLRIGEPLTAEQKANAVTARKTLFSEYVTPTVPRVEIPAHEPRGVSDRRWWWR